MKQRIVVVEDEEKLRRLIELRRSSAVMKWRRPLPPKKPSGL